MQLKDIAIVKGGKRLPKTDKLVSYKTDHPYIRIKDMYQSYPLELNDDFEYITDETYKKIKRYIVNQGDVIVAVVGNTIGLVSLIGPNLDGANLTENCNKLVGLHDYDNRFLYYFLISNEGQDEIKKGIVGSSQPKLPIYNIEKIEIPDIPLEQQVKIVEVLESIDKKISNNEEINRNLEQQISALYQSWFEDFKITNGVCPENWSYQELSTIADIASGKRPPVKADTCNEKTPISIVGAASVMGFTSEANHTDKILVTGRVGTHGVIQRFNTPCWTSDNTLVITSPYYEFTNQILHRIDYSSMNRGSTQPLITQGDMKKVVVLVPDEDTLAKFEEFAGSLMAKWEANNNENVKLASLRDTLLPKLMSGELDVSRIDL